VEVYDARTPARLRDLGDNLSMSCLQTRREDRRTPRRKRNEVRRDCGRVFKGSDAGRSVRPHEQRALCLSRRPS
jgi:hypothetical protein